MPEGAFQRLSYAAATAVLLDGVGEVGICAAEKSYILGSKDLTT